MPKNRRNVVPFLLILFVIILGGYFLLSRGIIPNPFKPKPQIRLNTQYLNPFEKETHYVNPFDEYKNPFDVIGKDEKLK